MEAKAEMLKKQYQLRFATLGEYRNQVWQVLCKEYFARYVPSNSVILDLGSGWGEFINNIVAFEKYAMDLNPTSFEYLSPKVKYIQQDCSQKWAVKSASLDVVFSSNFLEHLYDKASIERTVSEAYRCLKDSGLIIFMSPNIKFLPGAYWDFWDHHIPLTELSCSEMLKISGFEIEQCIPKFLPYSMSMNMKPPVLLVKLYLKLPVLWNFFGKQFIVIGRKKTQVTLVDE